MAKHPAIVTQNMTAYANNVFLLQPNSSVSDISVIYLFIIVYVYFIPNMDIRSFILDGLC